MPRRAKDYSLSVIYKIVNNVDDKEYFGSTAQKNPSSRWSSHTYDARHGKPARVFQHMRKVGVDNCRMVLLEKYPCKDQKELEIREEWWRAKAKQVLNERRCHCTKQERKQQVRQNDIRYTKMRFTCACGGRTSQKSRYTHVKTKMHQKWAKEHPTLTEYSQFLTRV